jgi:hypothetical protein
VTGEAEAAGVGDCDDEDGVFCTGIGNSTESPSATSLVERRSG